MSEIGETGERVLAVLIMFILAVFSPFVLLHEFTHAFACILTGNQFGGFTLENFPLSVGSYCRIGENPFDRFMVGMSPLFVVLPVGLALFLFRSFPARGLGFLALMAAFPSEADILLAFGKAPAGLSVLSYGMMFAFLLAFIVYNILYLWKGWV